MDLTNKTELLNYLKCHGLWAKKGLGQNFLVDRVSLDKIVETAELKHDDLVLEIGPGAGSLTSELLKLAGEVVTIEKDEGFAKLLPEITNSEFQITNKISNNKDLKIGNLDFDLTLEIRNSELTHKLRIINADILKLNLEEVVGTRKYKVVANIPYYITSKIIELFLTAKNKPEILVLLVQKEVAERICAKPGEMSVLSVSVQLYGKPEIVDIVPADSFFPAPKVDSAIIKIFIARNEETKQSLEDRHAALAMTKEEEKEFFRCVHIGFASRRKTLVNNLSAVRQLADGIDKKAASDIIKSIGLNENTRAQELTIENWRELCRRIQAKT